jgi:signal transduction histidine kinase
VIRNVISNALKYVNEGDEITFQASKVDKGTQIIVQDNGIGMEEERLKVLFQKKQDAEPGTHNELGSGLGLLISYDFIQMHKGTIDIESELEKGTKVTLFWPDKK